MGPTKGEMGPMNGERARKTYEYYVEKGVIDRLDEKEEKDYFEFHQIAYHEDLETARKLLGISARWAVVSGYYSMHTVTKLYLGRAHGLKIAKRFVHDAVIKALERVLQEGETARKVLELLDEAKETYELFDSYRSERVLPQLLRRSKSMRESASYYTTPTQKFDRIYGQRALRFLNEVVEPYISIVEELIKDAA